MRDALTRRLDPWHAALAGARVSGRLDARRLPRLATLATPAGYFQVSLGFEPLPSASGRHAAGAVSVSVSVTGSLVATCQRCLEPLTLPLQVESRVTVATPAASEQLDGETEVIVSEPGDALDLATLVEDEVMLALPFALTHPRGECAARRTDDVTVQATVLGVEQGAVQGTAPGQAETAPARSERRDNPFAVLEALRQRDRNED